MTTGKFKYDFMRYNRHFVLRVNMLTLLILCYLCKDIFLVIGIGATAFKGRGGDVSDIMVLVSPIFFLSDLPAILVAYALLVRQPSAGYLPRFIWKNGRLLISLSASVHILLLAWRLDWDINNMILMQWLAVLVDFGIVVYMVSSEFIKDLFTEFPARQAEL